MKFELFGGCLGNGTTVYNKAVMENGDYKKICHISNAGTIKWYISNPSSYVPQKDMETIEKWSRSARKSFLESWNKLPDIRKYGICLNFLSYAELMQEPLKSRLQNTTDLHDKVTILEELYMNRI